MVKHTTNKILIKPCMRADNYKRRCAHVLKYCCESVDFDFSLLPHGIVHGALCQARSNILGNNATLQTLIYFSPDTQAALPSPTIESEIAIIDKDVLSNGWNQHSSVILNGSGI